MMPRLLCMICLALLLSAAAAHGQAPVPDQRERRILRLEATPAGALPPLPLPMPASRDHHYWIGRLQTGYRTGRAGPDMLAVGGGVDLQWLGGSVFGLTAGYQARECPPGSVDCGGHFLAGVGARLNLVAGGPGPFAGAFNDYSGTTTVGIATSFGYAPDVIPGMDACTIDLGLPISTALFQTVRISTFVTPGVVWDLGCGADHGGPMSSRLAAGIGVLQLGHPGLDVFLGAQRTFRSGTGYHFGITVMYVRLP